jgi:hypothetical protein
MAKKTESSIPNAARFVDLLVGKGGNYVFETAIADVVDNAIEAMASKIQIEIDFVTNTVFLLDNGRGMSDVTHREAMKFASETRSYTEKDLGKFGTGMKAASLSQAERLTVATRAKGSKDIFVRCLDRAHIRETNDWNSLTILLEAEDLPKLAQEHLKKTHGTVVIWENLSILSEARGVAHSEMANELLKATKATDLHLSMIYHRFLSGETRDAHRVEITINGNQVEPYDPFARDEKTWTLETRNLPVNGEPVTLTGYVLPPEKEWSSTASHKEHGRPKGWNASQGFYIYRNDRLIQWGTWLKIRKAEPHLSLARISLDFTSALDDVFGVTVDKSKVTLPEAVKERLDVPLQAIVKKANERYRSKASGLNAGILPGRQLGPAASLKKKLTASALVDLLERVSTVHGKKVELETLKNLIREESPSVAKEIGW